MIEALRKDAQDLFGEGAIYLHLRQRKTQKHILDNNPNNYIITVGEEPIWCIISLRVSSHLSRLINARINRFCSIIRSSQAKEELADAFLIEILKDKRQRALIESKFAPNKIKNYLLQLLSNPPRIIVIADAGIERAEETCIGLKINPAVLIFRKLNNGKVGTTRVYLFEPLQVDELSKDLSSEKPNDNRVNEKLADLAESTPRSAFELPLLELIIELGGTVSTREVEEKFYEKMKNQLKDMDFEAFLSGSLRWSKHVHWTRNSLKNKGYIKRDSPTGFWEITEEGKKYYQRIKLRCDSPG